MLIIGFAAALIVSYKKPWFNQLLKDKLVWLILIFALLNTLLAIVRPTDQDAEVLGLVYNTRFLVFFLYGLLLARIYKGQNLLRQGLKVVLTVATVVLFFGIVQYTVLPDDALRHVGYERANGVLPAFFIDDKPDLERVMSTIRDPNSLGSYIIIIGSLALTYFISSKNAQLRGLAGWIFVLSISCLWFTFSRSALLGFALAAVIIAAPRLKQFLVPEALRKYSVAAAILILIAGASSLYALRDNYFVQNIVFHSSENSQNKSSNDARYAHQKESIKMVIDQPLGAGPGTAGPASIHNEIQGIKITENYYLQTAYELGFFGLLLFLSILFIVGKRLHDLSQESTMALGLFASFIGLVLTNFLVHIWANEAVAYTWWGLAGLVLFRITDHSSVAHGSSKEAVIIAKNLTQSPPFG